MFKAMMTSVSTMKGKCWPSLPKVSTDKRLRCTNVGEVASIFIATFKPKNLPLLFTAELLNSDGGDDNRALQICELVSASSNFFERPLKNPVSSATKLR